MRDENFFTFYLSLLLRCRKNGVFLPRMTPPRQPQADPDAALLRAEVERLRVENQLLRDKISDLIRRLYDKKSETIDPAQLALPFDPGAAGPAEAAATAGQGPAAGTAPAGRRSPNKPRDLSHLEVRETVIVHDEVLANPDAYREIQRIVTDRFDYQPPAVFIERTVRVVHVAIGRPDAVPLKPPAPRSLELSATARMVAYSTASKYCHHRPHFRTEGILRDRHGVEIPRHTLCHWDKVVADTLEPLYKLIHRELLRSGYLQADETPVRFQKPGNGKCATGYLWVIHAPRNGIRGDILYQWHPSRKASCLDDLLGDFAGFLQTDAYAAYDSWADGKKPGILRLSCWAHARRKFHEAFKLGQALAAGPLAAIQGLYRIEADLRRRQASPGERARVRQEQAAPLLQTLKADLLALRQRPEVLPKSPLGKAIDYTLALWGRLTVYLDHGQLEIDSNWIENGIRPTAVGKKAWLFMGGETTGQRAAIIYTLVECAKRHGHNPEAYLADVLQRLPAMTNQDDLGALLPSRWQPAPAPAPGPAAKNGAAACGV
ncbi:MAG: IS66 family transposase [Candidatus Competibacteraceae bacterium]